MFFIPLNQAESVELVIHALRMAGGEADCTTCPARKVCMKQCLSVADAVQGMLDDGTLPELGIDGNAAPAEEERDQEAGEEGVKDEENEKGRHLKIIK
ncbi:MAG: hypothetical protein R6V08_04875 [Desulfuromonadales bacterium]